MEAEAGGRSQNQGKGRSRGGILADHISTGGKMLEFIGTSLLVSSVLITKLIIVWL